MTTPEEKVEVKKVQQPTPQWAWLQSDEMEEVHIVVVQGPEAIFLRRNKFSDCLEKLTKDIQKHLTEHKNNSQNELLDVGDVCLGKLSDTEEWNRALIKSKEEDKVDLFFVDFGDKEVVPWSQVVPIPNKFITQLPFQIIECFLGGVKFLQPDPDNKEWEDEVVDIIYNFSRNEEEVAIPLVVKVCSTEEQAMYTNGKRYKIMLADCNVEPNVILNSQLVASDYAELAIEEMNETMKAGNRADSTESEDDIPTSSNKEVVPVNHNLDVALRDESTMTEDEKKFEQILRDLEAGVFDCSSFDVIENDADISDNAWEGSGLSLPCAKGSLPSSFPSPLALPPTESEDSRACTTNTISSSQNSSTLSLVDSEKTSGALQRNQADPPPHLQLSSLTLSSPKCDQSMATSTPINQQHSDLSGASTTSAKQNWNVKELISSNFLGQSGGSPSFKFVQNISPHLMDVSQTTPPFLEDDDLDNDHDNTVCELNNVETKQKSSQLDKVDDSNHKNYLSAELKTDSEETVEDIKSPRTMQWVLDSISESDESRNKTVIAEDLQTPEVRDSAEAEVRTPLVEWHQDNDFVFLRVKLPALQKHEVIFDVDSVHFRTEYGGVPYEMNVSLFGAHHKDRARGSAEAFYFEIRLEKILKGKKKRWPRLTRQQQKPHWLKLNAEKACEEMLDSEDEDLKRLACTLPCWNDNATETNSQVSSELSEAVNSEMSV